MKETNQVVQPAFTTVPPALWWIPLAEFAVHLVVGSGIFLLIGGGAIGLDLLMQWLAKLGVSSYIIVGLLIAKIALFSMDLILFLLYLANTGLKFVKSLHWRNALC